MSEVVNHELRQELEALRKANEQLNRKVAALADANAHAAELLAALEEAHEREQTLVRRGEELDLQRRLDLALQEELAEHPLLKRVILELEETTSLGVRTASFVLDHPESSPELLSLIRQIPLDQPPARVVDYRLDVPVHNAGKPVGAIRLVVGKTDERWCERWIQFLWSVGSQVGLALQRLRVEHDNQRMNAELTVARDEALEASRIKTAFLANMSHELRTPMNAIIGYSEMLIEEGDDLDPAEMVADLRKIQTAGKHLLSLINDVLDLSKIEAGKMTVFLEPYSIQEAVHEVVSTIQPLVSRNRNQIAIECPEGIGSMVGDLVKFRQSLFNLLSNACKFTHNGQIWLKVTPVVRAGLEFVDFAVKDTGIGMTPLQIGNLFQAFVQADNSATRKYEGTGLGLTISRKFCNLMGGDIRVSSESGKGSTFTIELPRFCNEIESAHPQAPGRAVAAQVVPPEEQELARATILTIDDNPEALELVGRYLSREGYRVLTASSGEVGLTLARTHQPDVITLDVMMPQMNGWQVLAALKADPQVAAIPVVLLSVVENKEIGFALGATDCLTKPVDWAKLDSLLGRLTHHTQPDHILVVEDDPASSELTRRLLEREGWQIQTAQNGAQALELIQECRPALIVLDLMMPIMDGFTFTETLRAVPEYARIPIVVLTSKSLSPEEYRRLNGWVEQILTKGGYSRSDFLNMVSKLADTAQTRNQPFS